MEGILIAVEGIDGAGKTTQVNLLAEALKNAGEIVRVSKEPTDGHWGSLIRKASQTARMPLEAELEAFHRDREEHVEKVIRPALEAGEVVILDRYFYSYIAYQGARGANMAQLKQTSSFAPVPDDVFLLDIDPRLSLWRIAEQRGFGLTVFESEPELKKVRNNFLKLVSEGDAPIHKLEASRSIPDLHSAITQILLNGTLKRKRCSKSYGCDDPFHCTPRATGQCRWSNLHRALASPQQHQTVAEV